MVIAIGWLCFSFYLSIPGKDFLSGLREVLQSPAAFFSTIAVFCFVIALLGVLYRIVSGTLTVSQAGLAVLLRTEDTVLRGEELPPVKTLVGRLAEMPAIQNMGAVGVQVGMLNGLPARHWESPAAFGAILATMPRENAQPHPKRALAQFIVNLLLAVGIVGTFYGLINFLSDPVFLGVLADPRTIQGANSNLTTIAHSFRIAFGTSLLAYGLHAAGRTILDILDDDADAVWKAYQVRLLLPLIHAFPNRPDTLEFRLRGRPEVALDKVAAALQAAGSEIQQTRQDLMATVHAMIAHARTMAAMAEEAKGAAAVAGAGAATVGEAAGVITGGLRDTVTVFSAGTAEFKTAATALKTAIDTQTLIIHDRPQTKLHGAIPLLIVLPRLGGTKGHDIPSLRAAVDNLAFAGRQAPVWFWWPDERGALPGDDSFHILRDAQGLNHMLDCTTLASLNAGWAAALAPATPLHPAGAV